ncbi:FecR domain-containing protein [Rapidithrix thailandica]|uniref:FecR domain-containing protein n=1 Tax=Rapidithrix thailandica TaxID=413964 RepID=A0AAW9S8X9_9BACT
MKYKEYQLEDFLEDEYFISWVKYPTKEKDYFWETWLDKHPGKSKEVALAKEIINSATYQHTFQPTEQEFLEVLENIHRKKKSLRWGRRNVTGQPLQRLYRYAAVLVMLIIAGLGYWYMLSRLGEPPHKSVYVRKEALAGQKIELTLPDDSKVKLNSETKLRYLQSFDHSIREVYLEGEAYFDVTRDEERPFVIHTGEIQTKVLGTSFNIQAYPEESEIQVAVRTGKVQVHNKVETQHQRKTSLILHPNEMAVYHKQQASIQKTKVDIRKILAWKDNLVLFKDADFPEIKSILERWYNVQFIVPQDLKVTEEFSGSFYNTPLEEVLDALNYTSTYHYSLKDHRVILTQK